MGDPALHVQRLGRRVNIVGQGEPAAGIGEGGEPPGGRLVAGAVRVVVEGHQDAGGRAEAIDPFLPAAAGRGAGGHDGNGVGDTVATRLGHGQGIDLAFDEDDRLVHVEAVGVEQGVAEAGRPQVFRLPGGNLRGRHRPAHIDAPERTAGEPGDCDPTG